MGSGVSTTYIPGAEGWLMLDCGTVRHVMPGLPDLTVTRDHELNAYCWCGPQHVEVGPLDTPILSHNDPSAPGSDRPRGFIS